MEAQEANVMEATSSTKQEEFKTWVLTYSDMLYSYACAKGFDHDAAKDLVQDTFFAAWKAVDGFEGRASVKNWLFVILKNKITDHYRKALQHRTFDISEHDHYFDETGHWAKSVFPKALVVDPSSEADTNDFHRILESCSGKMNTVQKAVFWMKYIDDMESSAICGQLAISANNYWTMLHRAKVQLRACIEKNWFLTKGI